MDFPEQKTAGDNTPQTTRPGEGGYEQVERRDVLDRGYIDDSDSNSELGSVEDPGILTEDEWEGGEVLPNDEVEDAIAGYAVDEDFGEDEDVMDSREIEVIEGEEPDFAGYAGTTDVTLAVEEGEPYFPPTDPVIGPSVDSTEGIEVLGGFSTTSMEGPTDREDVPSRLGRGDDELADDVIAALRGDAYTTDLNIEVEVVDGVVYLRGQVQSIEDVEQVEEVAGRVTGVLDVEEQLDLS